MTDLFVPPARLTWDLVRDALPDDGKRRELIDGALHVTPAPTTRHQRIVGRIFNALYELERRGLGMALVAPLDVVLDPENAFQPDVVFVRQENVARIVRDEGVIGAPDLVVEVLSPTTRRRDVLTKVPTYARLGVPACWIVDPDVDRIELLRARGGVFAVEATLTPPGRLAPADLPGLDLDLVELFAR